MFTEGVPCSKHWELRETQNNPFPPATPGIGERVGQWELLVQEAGIPDSLQPNKPQREH